MLRHFVSEHFIPSKMVLAVVADIDESALEKQVLSLIEHAFSPNHR